MTKRTALVAGATGLVGGEVVAALLANPAYDRVTVLVRRTLPLNHPKLEQRVVDFDRLEEQVGPIQADDLYCCLGTTIGKAGSQAAFRKVDFDYPLALARLAKQGAVQRFLLVSSKGASTGSSYFYMRVKGEVEQAIGAIGLEALHIFRPSLLLGNRQDFRFGERIAVWLAPLYTPLMIGSWRQYRPIHARTVAAAMVRAALEGAPGIHTYESEQVAELGR